MTGKYISVIKLFYVSKRDNKTKNRLHLLNKKANTKMYIIRYFGRPCDEFAERVWPSSNNKTLNARLLARHKFVTGATLLQLESGLSKSEA